jgi:hypothetical protein
MVATRSWNRNRALASSAARPARSRQTRYRPRRSARHALAAAWYAMALATCDFPVPGPQKMTSPASRSDPLSNTGAGPVQIPLNFRSVSHFRLRRRHPMGFSRSGSMRNCCWVRKMAESRKPYPSTREERPRWSIFSERQPRLTPGGVKSRTPDGNPHKRTVTWSDDPTKDSRPLWPVAPMREARQVDQEDRYGGLRQASRAECGCGSFDV